MSYEASRLSAYQSYQHWVSAEVFTVGWFVMIGVLLVTYAIWFKLVDKSRIRDLLLLGSLLAVGFGVVGIILGDNYGFWDFHIRPVPMTTTLFTVSYTIGPILYMMVAQYTTSWKSYLIWSSIGTAVITFGLLPIYGMLGIVTLHNNYNFFYNFIYYMTGAIIGRAICFGLARIEQSQSTPSRVAQSFLGLQPAATKPLDEDDKTDSGQ